MKIATMVVWALFTVLWIGLLTEPTGTQAQFILGAGACVVMAVIRLLRLKGIWRTIFQALGTGVVLRYLFWRSTSTLPSVSDIPSFVCGITLFAAELYSIVMLFISLFVVSDPLQRPPAPMLSDADKPTVDVFVPSYNEDRDLLAITLAAASAIRYPVGKLKVHLLDDGGTDQKCNDSNALKAAGAKLRRADLKDLAREVGATYHTRAKNLHAKAGNMNSALGNTHGEIIVVFDADHVPMPDFLEKTIGHFRRDPRLFLCQTPHFFSNPDPIEKNLQTFQVMPSENEMFYGVIQRGLDKWNGAFFCGSAALVRRRALEEVGGFSGISITEDCETALDLHSRGWTSVYVDKPLVSGLQPDTFAAFIGQRSRWCRGMFQIFLLKNPMFKRGLSFSQRIAYLSNMSYWFFPVFRLPFLIAPFLYIWFSLQIYVANIHEFFSYTMIYMVANIMMQNYMYGDVRWPFVSELYEFVQSIYLSRGLLSVILNPRKPTFNVTDKGMSLDNDFLSELAMPYFGIFLFVLLSQAYAAFRYFHETDNNDLLIVVSVWNFLNLILSGAGLGVVAERKVVPRSLDHAVEVTVNGMILPAAIDKLTPRGCLLDVDLDSAGLAEVAVGTAAVLRVPKATPEGVNTLALSLVAFADGKAEFSFVGMMPQHYRLIVSILHPGSENLQAFRDKRRRHKSIFGGIWNVISWGFTEPPRGFMYLARHLKEVAAQRVARKSAAAPSVEAPPPVHPAAPPSIPDPTANDDRDFVPADAVPSLPVAGAAVPGASLAPNDMRLVDNWIENMLGSQMKGDHLETRR